MDEWERRKLIAMQAAYLFIDFPALICGVVVLLSWRGKSLWTKLRQVNFLSLSLSFSLSACGKCVYAIFFHNSAHCDTSPQTNISKDKSAIIFEEFLQYLIDLPFVVVGVCSLWRAPLLLQRALNEVSRH